jgi:N-acetylmuramic acid 6-phosphate etherase
MARAKPGTSDLITESSNPRSAGLDRKSSLDMIRTINREDATVAAAVRRALPEIAHAIDLIADALSHGGRLIYVGAGTSGRIGALDAAECPSTFNTDPELVQFIISGGRRALGAPVEANEDSQASGRGEMAKKKPTKCDVVVGIAASGRTPFTVAAIQYARKLGAKTIALTCNRNSPLEKTADLAIIAEVGPEVLSGSTRMKGGTAQKMILNMLTTGAMTRLGYVYDHFMVNLNPRNSKLRERAVSILEQAAGVSRRRAENALAQSSKQVPAALVMLKTGADRRQAQLALKACSGNVRSAISKLHGG